MMQAVHALLPEQADLPVPVSGVGVPVDPVLRTEMNARDRVLLLPLLFADADGLDACGLCAHGQRIHITYLFTMLYNVFPVPSSLSAPGGFCGRRGA